LDGEGLRFVISLFVLLLLMPSASACISYAYTTDERTNHRSLLTSNAFHFGTFATLVTDCENGSSLFVNGEEYAFTNSVTSVPLPEGLHNLSIKDDDGMRNFVNVRIVSNEFLFEAVSQNPTLAIPGGNDFTDSELSTREVIIAVGTFLIIYAAVVGYHWRRVSEEVDATFFMEVR
jgi:hypothetical protein